MNEHDDCNLHISIGRCVMLGLEMAREALVEIDGSDQTWLQTDIAAEPAHKGRPIEELKKLKGYEDATGDEFVRTIRIKGSYVGQNGFTQFEAVCRINRYRSRLWEPLFVDVKIDSGINYPFMYVPREIDFKLIIKERNVDAA